jgi:hypothetical protein
VRRLGNLTVSQRFCVACVEMVGRVGINNDAPRSPRPSSVLSPLCYMPIGGLSVATFIELLLVPVLYAVFVLDLKLVTWEAKVERSYVGSTEGET